MKGISGFGIIGCALVFQTRETDSISVARSNYVMPVSRKDVNQYAGNLSEFYCCLTKISYDSRLVATKFAYALECIRHERIYDVYICPYCGKYHIGRKKPAEKTIVTKRADWIWNRDR